MNGSILDALIYIWDVEEMIEVYSKYFVDFSYGIILCALFIWAHAIYASECASKGGWTLGNNDGLMATNDD